MKKRLFLFIILATALLCLTGCLADSKGDSAYDIYKKYYPDYGGTEEQWINDLANGKLARFSVAFDINGGTLISGSVVQSVYTGQAAAGPEITKEGYDLCWDKSFGNVTEDLIVTAVWTKKNCKLTFIFPEDVIGDINETLEIQYGKTLRDINENVAFNFLRPGYYFTGWYNGENKFNEYDAVKTGMTLTSRWEKQQIILNTVTGGTAYVESYEASGMYTRYRIIAVPDEGYCIKEWNYVKTGGYANIYTGKFSQDICSPLLGYQDYRCEITPVFTNDPAKMHKITVLNYNPEGGTVVFPEYTVKDCIFEVTITAKPGYYISDYGYMIPGEPIGNYEVINVIHFGFHNESEILYMREFWHIQDNDFGKGEDREFFVNFVKQSDAVIIKAMLYEGPDDSISNEKGSIRTGRLKVAELNQYYFASAEANAGYEFSHWIDEEENIISYDSQLQYKVTELKEKIFYPIFIKIE